MKICFICDTPYQLFCVLNIVYVLKNMEKTSKPSCNLYIGMNFKNADRIYENVCEEDLFDNVYRFDIKRGAVRNIELIKYFLHLLIMPHDKLKLLNCVAKEYSNKYITKLFVIKRYISLTQMAFGYEYDLSNQYNVLFASYFNPFVKNMSLFSPNAHISYFEDGRGSYVGNIFDFALKQEPDTKFSLANINIRRFKPVDLYVFRPNLCEFSDETNIIKMPIVYNEDSGFRKKVRKIYEYNRPDIYSNMKVVFLMTSEEEIELLGGENNGKTCLSKYKNIVETLRQEDCNVVFRKHPRQKKDHYNDLKVDDTGTQWELLIQEIISDDSILISLNSTASLSPKLLYDKEPYNILFGQYVFEGTDMNEANKKYERILKNIYRDKEKIVVVKSQEEFVNSFRKIYQGRND